ncbi:MAG: hypothetical protein ACOX6O_06910 [Christensenellales bacterium]|jgi:hypothetical protein
MDEKARKARNAYLRAWRARNRDRVKAYNENYWRRKAAKLERESSKNSIETGVNRG